MTPSRPAVNKRCFSRLSLNSFTQIAAGIARSPEGDTSRRTGKERNGLNVCLISQDEHILAGISQKGGAEPLEISGA
jgi:hypothetical protein